MTDHEETLATTRREPHATLTRREMLLALPGLAIAHRLTAQQVPTLRLARIHSVRLAVNDVARSLDFYQELFGAAIQARQGETVLLQVAGGPMFFSLEPAGPAGPTIAGFGLAVEDFSPERVMGVLAAHRFERVRTEADVSAGPRRAALVSRGDTPEIWMSDPHGLVVQLQDPRYCGGGGPLGDRCGTPDSAPGGAPLTLTGVSHLTNDVPNADAANAFYQGIFDLDIQAYQADSPILGVGPGPDFLMFIGLGAAQPRVHHACFYIEDFDVERVQGALEAHGVRPREGGGTPPMAHWVSMRMPNRGGAPDGTPELYFSDPDGLSIQLQDAVYCGGGGYLGGIC